MNLPNKLTIFRVILIPFFVACYLIGGVWGNIAALIIFIVASLTDLYDGKIAREKNQVTTFGKLMDPLADKILIMSALICFVQNGVNYLNAGVVIVILARELIVTGLRLIALAEKKVIAASMWGKAKTVSQLVLVIGIMVFEIFTYFVPKATPVCDVITLIFVVVAVILTAVSGLDYIVKNRGLLKFK